MKTTASFDLNQTIQRWRENLAQSPAFRSENLDELEAHLQDLISSLQSRGLSAAEAFQIAAQRLGAAEQLDAEFSKANPVTVWQHRALWMLVGMLFWTVWADLTSIIKSMGIYIGSWVITNGLVLGWVGGTLHLLMFVCVIVCFWLLANGRLARFSGMEAMLSQRPALFISLVLGFVLVAEIAAPLLFTLTYRHLEPMVIGQRFAVEAWFMGVIPVLKWIAAIWGLVWLSRRRLRRAGASQLASWGLLALLATGWSSFPAIAQNQGNKTNIAVAEKKTATMEETMKLWRDGKQSEAVEKFLTVDFSKRPLFPTGSVLNYTEPQFAALPQAARDKLSQQMLADIKTVKVLSATVKRAGEDALESGDKAKAETCFAQLTKCGDAFTHPDSLALLKLVGRAVKDLVPEPTQPKAPATK